MTTQKTKSSARLRADAIKPFRVRNVVAVIEYSKLPANIASVIRNVNALGIEKVYVIGDRGGKAKWENVRETSALNKLSASAIKWTFVKWFDTTEDCIRNLKRNHFVSVVTSPHIKGIPHSVLDEMDFTRYTKLAVWFGSESRGITDEAVQNAVKCVSIPMYGMVESLNLGTTSGIVLYEVAKQRRNYDIAARLKRYKLMSGISTGKVRDR